MNSAIELHDSVICQIQEIGRDVVVEFSPAYVHKSQGRPGIDPGSGWSQNARLTLTGALVSADLPALPESVSDGDLNVAGRKHSNLLPVPLTASGPIELRLVFRSGHEVVISGDAIELKLMGEVRCLEEFDASE
jgi:hypothetical protein